VHHRISRPSMKRLRKSGHPKLPALAWTLGIKELYSGNRVRSILTGQDNGRRLNRQVNERGHASTW
jgi:hypothetical protein